MLDRLALTIVVGFALTAPAAESAAAPPSPAIAPASGVGLPAIESHASRGVYYFAGAAPCPLAGIGTRGPNACNRVALDDDHSRVVIDRGAHRIVFTNSQSYPSKRVIADVEFVSSGATKAGDRVPIAVHLKIEKKGGTFKARAHAHPTIHEDVVSADFEPYQVVVSDGTTETTVLDHETTVQTALKPDVAARLANALVEVKNNLGGHLAAAKPSILADISIGLGLGKLSKMVMRAQLIATSGALAADGQARLAKLINSGEWELRLTALSSLIPQDVLQRELFLCGLDGLTVLDGLKRDSLKKGESLVFGMKDGKSMVTFGKDSQELPNAADVARAFLEFSFVGAILEHQAVLAVVK